jgi:quercetin dioxygenase-like cupin family protein
MTPTHAAEAARIEHLDQLPRYAPARHWGTLNVRLVEAEAGAGYEMILGTMAPDGGSERHHHARQHQAMFILEGEALVELGGAGPQRCGPGSVIRIPPGIPHRILGGGAGTLRFIVVFSPPLEAAAP